MVRLFRGHFSVRVSNGLPYFRSTMAVDRGLKHTVPVLVGGSLISFGNGKHGQLGIGTNHDEQHPVSVEIDHEFDYPAPDDDDCQVVFFVSAGLSHTACVTEKGHVLTWG